MSVYRDKRKGWIVDVVYTFPDGRKERKKQKSPVQTRRGAMAFERQLRESLLNPGAPQRQAPTFREYAVSLLEHAEIHNKFTTQCAKRTILNCHLLPVFGRMRLDAIKRQHVDSYKARKIRAGYSPKTVNNHLTVLRKALSLAFEDELIDKIPPVKWLKVAEQDFDFLDFDEADRLLRASQRDPLWYTMIMVALRTGLRQGELLALQWDDLDLVAGRVVVRRRDWRGNIDTPKGGRSREIPLTPQCQAVLKSYRHLRGDLVFCKEDGSPLTYGQCKRPMWGYCKLAGLRRIGWHVCRHTFCSHLAMKGVPLKVIQEYAGHSDIRITMRYAHLSPEVGREAVALLDEPGCGPYAAPARSVKSMSLETK